MLLISNVLLINTVLSQDNGLPKFKDIQGEFILYTFLTPEYISHRIMYVKLLTL